jgi:hypothetical protein
LRTDVTGQSTSTNYSQVRQYIEDVTNFAGETVTLSFWAKAASGTPDIAANFVQNFGTGGSPSTAAFATTAQKVTISSSWARYSMTFAIASISGKTLGTNANTSSLELRLYLSAGTAFDAESDTLGIQTNTFDLWGFQIEAGNVATAFQTATGTLQGELAACQRYYQKSYNLDTAPATVTQVGQYWIWVGTAGTQTLGTTVHFPVEMRTTPTVTLYDNQGASGKVNRPSSGKIGGTVFDGTKVLHPYSSDTTSAAEFSGHYVASAEL